MAATRSAFSVNPHATQRNTACILRFSFETRPQHGQVLEVFIGGTAIRRPPAHRSLYSNCRRNSLHPWSRMDLFRPDLARTFLPGFSALPFADRDMLFTCRSSTTTIAWLLLMAVEALCRKSRRALAMRRWMRWTLAFAFFQLFEN